MATAHKGAISFGLVHIPVSLYRTVREHDISFNQLCKKTKQRVHYKKYCGNCEKELKKSLSLSVMVNAFNSSTQETEARRFVNSKLVYKADSRIAEF